MSRCSAPAFGHRKPGSAKACPVHGDASAAMPGGARSRWRPGSPRRASAKRDTEKVAMAKSLHTPPEVLAELARDEDVFVRWAVALNPSTPPETVTELARDDDWMLCGSAVREVRCRIAVALGIDESNKAASDMMREQAWWEMTPDSPAVILALALHANA